MEAATRNPLPHFLSQMLSIQDCDFESSEYKGTRDGVNTSATLRKGDKNLWVRGVEEF